MDITTQEEAIYAIKDREDFSKKIFDDFRGNREVVLAAIKEDGWNIFSSEFDVLEHKDIVIEAIKRDHNIVQALNLELRNNKEIMLVALDKTSNNYKYIGDELKDDKDILLIAVKNQPSIFELANTDIRENVNFILTALKEIEHHTDKRKLIEKSSKKIQELCGSYDCDPTKAIESFLFAEKLQNELSQKTEQKQTKRIKI